MLIVTGILICTIQLDERNVQNNFLSLVKIDSQRDKIARRLDRLVNR